MSNFAPKHDLYRILRISPSASVQEIKDAYRRLVLELHPDRHDERDDEASRKQKIHQFKRVSEAYSTLMQDASKRSNYDASNRRRTAPLYRKVYAPQPPPNFKTWDHKVHFDMHYGDGIKEESLKSARLRAEKEGAFRYESPLGKGFSFAKDPNENFNPYAKRTPQGPQTVTYEYEEGYRNMDSKREHLSRRDRVVEDMYGRRSERRARNADQPKQQYGHMQQRYNTSFANNNEQACVIL